MAKPSKSSGGSFGQRLKGLREMEGFTVEALAELVGMKPAQVAKLESDAMLPPVADIIRLARVLSVEPSVFMSDAPAPGRRERARSTRTAEYAYETLTPEDQRDSHLMAFRVKIDPQSAHKPVGYQHDGEEFILVLSGKLTIKVGKKTTTLSAGESIQFDSSQRHHLTNPGKEQAVLLVVLYTP